MIRQSVIQTKSSLAKGSLLESRISTQTFLSDFFYFQQDIDIDQYIAFFGNDYIGLVETDKDTLFFIIDNLVKSIYLNLESSLLFEKLFNSFSMTCLWKEAKCFTNGLAKDPGLYIIYYI